MNPLGRALNRRRSEFERDLIQPTLDAIEDMIVEAQQRDYLKRTPRELAYQAIDTERAYQDTKYGPQGDFHLSISGWEAIIKKHMTRLERETDAVEATKIIRKIAALCVACMEQHGAPPREPSALTSE